MKVLCSIQKPKKLHIDIYQAWTYHAPVATSSTSVDMVDYSFRFTQSGHGKQGLLRGPCYVAPMKNKSSNANTYHKRKER